MDRAAPGHDDAIPPQRDGGDDVGAGRVLAVHFRDLFRQRQFLGDGLQRGESDGQAGFAADRAHPLKLVPFALEVAGQFEHAVADLAHRAADGDQFFRRGGGAGDDFAVD